MLAAPVRKEGWKRCRASVRPAPGSAAGRTASRTRAAAASGGSPGDGTSAPPERRLLRGAAPGAGGAPSAGEDPPPGVGCSHRASLGNGEGERKELWQV